MSSDEAGRYMINGEACLRPRAPAERLAGHPISTTHGILI